MADNGKNGLGFHTARGYELLKRRSGRLTPAMEDYLEMIYRICSRDGYARVSRISQLLNVRPSSASKMILKLAQMGFLKYERYEIILLTEEGSEAGGFLLNRHNTVEAFLRLIGTGAPLLDEAEVIEHALSAEAVFRIGTLIDFFSQNPDVRGTFERFYNTHPFLKK